MSEVRPFQFRGGTYCSLESFYAAVRVTARVSKTTFIARLRRFAQSGKIDERRLEDAFTLDVVAFRHKYGIRKTLVGIDGLQVDLLALYREHVDEARVQYSCARQRIKSLQRMGPVSMTAVLDAFRMKGATWKTAYGGGRHQPFIYDGKEFPELIGRRFHGTADFLRVVGRYGDRGLVWSRLKAGWSLDSALVVPKVLKSARTGTVYRISRVRTGQFYIGLTLSSVEARWCFHLRAARAGATTKVAAAIREDGPGGFEVDVLESGIDGADLLAERERHWAEELGAFGPLGLNTAPAGGLGSQRGIQTELGGEFFRSRNEAAQVFGEKHGIAVHVVRARLLQGLPVPDSVAVRRHSKHPEAGSNLFRRWLALLRRHPSAVASRWLGSYDAFKQDVSPMPAGLSLARRDNSLPWGPLNFEWVTDQTSVERVHGRAVMIGGVAYPSIRAAALHWGLCESTLKHRVFRQGMRIEDAVRKPLGVSRSGLPQLASKLKAGLSGLSAKRPSTLLRPEAGQRGRPSIGSLSETTDGFDPALWPGAACRIAGTPLPMPLASDLARVVATPEK